MLFLSLLLFISVSWSDLDEYQFPHGFQKQGDDVYIHHRFKRGRFSNGSVPLDTSLDDLFVQIYLNSTSSKDPIEEFIDNLDKPFADGVRSMTIPIGVFITILGTFFFGWMIAQCVKCCLMCSGQCRGHYTSSSKFFDREGPSPLAVFITKLLYTITTIALIVCYIILVISGHHAQDAVRDELKDANHFDDSLEKLADGVSELSRAYSIMYSAVDSLNATSTDNVNASVSNITQISKNVSDLLLATKKALEAVDFTLIPSAFSDNSLDSLFDSILSSFKNIKIEAQLGNMDYHSTRSGNVYLDSVVVEDVTLEDPLEDSQIVVLMNLSEKINSISSFNTTAEHLNETFVNVSLALYYELPLLYKYSAILRHQIKSLNNDIIPMPKTLIDNIDTFIDTFEKFSSKYDIPLPVNYSYTYEYYNSHYYNSTVYPSPRSETDCDSDSQLDCLPSSDGIISLVAETVRDALNYRLTLMQVPKQIEAVLVLTDNHPTITKEKLTSQQLSKYKEIIADGWILSRIRSKAQETPRTRVYYSHFTTAFLPDPLYSEQLESLSSFKKVHKLFNSAASAYINSAEDLDDGDGDVAINDIKRLSAEYSDDLSSKALSVSDSTEAKDVITYVNSTNNVLNDLFSIENHLNDTARVLNYVWPYVIPRSYNRYGYVDTNLITFGYFVHYYPLTLCIVACIIIIVAYVLHMFSLCSSCCTGCSIFTFFFMTLYALLFPILFMYIGSLLSEAALFIYGGGLSRFLLHDDAVYLYGHYMFTYFYPTYVDSCPDFERNDISNCIPTEPKNPYDLFYYMNYTDSLYRNTVEKYLQYENTTANSYLIENLRSAIFSVEPQMEALTLNHSTNPLLAGTKTLSMSNSTKLVNAHNSSQALLGSSYVTISLLLVPNRFGPVLHSLTDGITMRLGRSLCVMWPALLCIYIFTIIHIILQSIGRELWVPYLIQPSTPANNDSNVVHFVQRHSADGKKLMKSCYSGADGQDSSSIIRTIRTSTLPDDASPIHRIPILRHIFPGAQILPAPLTEDIYEMKEQGSTGAVVTSSYPSVDPVYVIMQSPAAITVPESASNAEASSAPTSVAAPPAYTTPPAAQQSADAAPQPALPPSIVKE